MPKRRGKCELRYFLNFAVANAGRAHAQALSCAVDERAHRLQVHVPAAFRYIVGMADAVTELGSASANLTVLCHKAEISLTV